MRHDPDKELKADDYDDMPDDTDEAEGHEDVVPAGFEPKEEDE